MLPGFYVSGFCLRVAQPAHAGPTLSVHPTVEDSVVLSAGVWKRGSKDSTSVSGHLELKAGVMLLLMTGLRA